MTPKLSSKRIVFDRYRKLVEATFSVRDSSVIKWVYMDCPSSVVILPVDSGGNVLLVKQFRYPHQKYTLELPMGFVDKNESVQDAAKRELFEETGYICDHFEISEHFMNMQGETNRKIYYVFAVNPTEVKDPEYQKQISIEEKAAGLTVKKVPFTKVHRSLCEGKSILDGIESNFAILLFASKLL